MRILVTGGNGQLGQCLRMASLKSPNEYIFTDVDDLDITNRDAVNLCMSVNCFDVVVNCAAFTDVEGAENRQNVAEEINCRAAGYLAQAAAANDMLMIHISTDYVFDGKGNSPIKENSQPNPCNAYGCSKLAGERAITETGCKALIFRTAWLYSEFGRNFVKTIARLSGERESLNVVIDQVGTPTYAGDLAKAIVSIIDSRSYVGAYGIYNYTNLGVCSWYDLAKATTQLVGHTNCTVMPCHTEDFPTVAKRPAYSVLDKTKFLKTFDLNIPFWLDSLKECIEKFKSETKNKYNC